MPSPSSTTSPVRWLGARGLFVGACITALATLVGCDPTVRVIHDDWADFPQDPKPAHPGAGQNPNQGYAVLLREFEGPNRRQRMFDFIRKIREQTDLADLWTQDRGGKATVYVGRFNRSGSFQAQTMLETVRTTKLHGEAAFKDQQLVAISGQRGGTQTSPYDLRQFAGRPGMRTLEVAIFTPEQANFRAAAEKRTDQLRRAGQKAFFYHGPHYSSVTIGLFTKGDFRIINKRAHYGPAIKSLQEKFPDLQVNGKKRLRDPDKPESGPEPTKIVRVPSF